jgi:SAM-dependent methyltransferase
MTHKQQVEAWWTDNPMTYGDVHGADAFQGRTLRSESREYFETLDQQFYGWNTPLHDDRPFGKLFPYDTYKGRRVLEVGCGLGTMIMNWARNGAAVTAVDLNRTSVTRTRQRFALLGLEGSIEQADARSLPFPDATFDYVYSWGVLHHSPDIEQSIKELMRILKPGGGFGIMLYNRRSILHWYMTEYIEGFLHYEHRFLGPLELASRYGDGHREEGNPHTWPVTRKEVLAQVAPYSDTARVRVLGTELDYAFRYLLPGLAWILPGWVKKPWARRFGWSLWIEGQRRGGH